MTRKIELLSPVGDFECLKAAVQNGADSVYFGASLFNARASAKNFDLNGLKDVINYCTIRNVKTHLTLNILIKDGEFEDAVNLALKAYEFGIDALIVQDLGLAKYLIDHFPDLPIHASTQMSIHNLEGVKEVEKLGFKRAVLARELSLPEIEYICANSNIEIETFIHGALCICYSGQCLLSSSIGGRSGNRGKCAQPCRLPYSLIKQSLTDSENEKIVDKGHLLSTRDLCGLEFLPDLINSGVCCFKIEGRLKNPEYVATVTRIYRKYIDMVLNNQDYIIDPSDKKDLLQVFNRGEFSTGHLSPDSNKKLVFKDSPSNQGIYLGNVSNYNQNKGHINLLLKDTLSIGDTIRFEKEDSLYTVSELMKGNQNFKFLPAGEKVTIGRMKGNIAVGNKIYKISSKELSEKAKKSYENCENRKIALDCFITIKKDVPISMEIRPHSTLESDNYKGIKIKVQSDIIPEAALKTPINVERVIKQISKTNNTPYTFENIKVYLDDGLYLPSISALNELRRTALSKLEESVINKKSKKVISEAISFPNALEEKEKAHPKISLFLRSLSTRENYENLDFSKIDRVYLPLILFTKKEFYDITNYFSTHTNLYIYLPTIIKSNYKNLILNSLEDILDKYKIKGFVISNIADFELLKNYRNKYEFVGNYSLNAFNRFSIDSYSKLGLSTCTISRELNKEDLKEILPASIDTELIVYGNLPVMAINYCLLGKANKCYPNCGTDCMANNIFYLKDRLGLKFQVIPDPVQTVTLICNSKTLSISTKDININRVRIDIINENVDEINHIVEVTYNRERLEGSQFTNGNLNKEV
mgnify:FL=1